LTHKATGCIIKPGQSLQEGVPAERGVKPISDSGNKYTGYRIEDIANELGLNKSTVSRAISGKGRISEDTRRLVNDFIREHGCKLNMVARGLAQHKTFNLGLALYDDCDMGEVPFFQTCANGICAEAGANEYDVVLFHLSSKDLTNLQRIIASSKIDGAVLTRTAENDPAVKLLQENDVPFVVVGSSDDSAVIHVDEDHVTACRELTEYIIGKGIRKPALLGGQMKLFVNKNRLKGFLEAAGQHPELEWTLDTELETVAAIDAALARALENGADCILCMDDYVCSMALACLARRHVQVAKDVSVATFYSSMIIFNNLPEITGIRFDAERLGETACANLLRLLAGETVEDTVITGHEIIPGASIRS